MKISPQDDRSRTESDKPKVQKENSDRQRKARKVLIICVSMIICGVAVGLGLGFGLQNKNAINTESISADYTEYDMDQVPVEVGNDAVFNLFINTSYSTSNLTYYFNNDINSNIIVISGNTYSFNKHIDTDTDIRNVSIIINGILNTYLVNYYKYASTLRVPEIVSCDGFEFTFTEPMEINQTIYSSRSYTNCISLPANITSIINSTSYILTPVGYDDMYQTVNINYTMLSTNSSLVKKDVDVQFDFKYFEKIEFSESLSQTGGTDKITTTLSLDMNSVTVVNFVLIKILDVVTGFRFYFDSNLDIIYIGTITVDSVQRYSKHIELAPQTMYIPIPGTILKVPVKVTYGLSASLTLHSTMIYTSKITLKAHPIIDISFSIINDKGTMDYNNKGIGINMPMNGISYMCSASFTFNPYLKIGPVINIPDFILKLLSINTKPEIIIGVVYNLDISIPGNCGGCTMDMISNIYEEVIVNKNNYKTSKMDIIILSQKPSSCISIPDGWKSNPVIQLCANCNLTTSTTDHMSISNISSTTTSTSSQRIDDSYTPISTIRFVNGSEVKREYINPCPLTCKYGCNANKTCICPDGCNGTCNYDGSCNCADNCMGSSLSNGTFICTTCKGGPCANKGYYKGRCYCPSCKNGCDQDGMCICSSDCKYGCDEYGKCKCSGCYRCSEDGAKCCNDCENGCDNDGKCICPSTCTGICKDDGVCCEGKYNGYDPNTNSCISCKYGFDNMLKKCKCNVECNNNCDDYGECCNENCKYGCTNGKYTGYCTPDVNITSFDFSKKSIDLKDGSICNFNCVKNLCDSKSNKCCQYKCNSACNEDGTCFCSNKCLYGCDDTGNCKCAENCKNNCNIDRNVGRGECCKNCTNGCYKSYYTSDIQCNCPRECQNGCNDKGQCYPQWCSNGYNENGTCVCPKNFPYGCNKNGNPLCNPRCEYECEGDKNNILGLSICRCSSNCTNGCNKYGKCCNTNCGYGPQSCDINGNCDVKDKYGNKLDCENGYSDDGICECANIYDTGCNNVGIPCKEDCEHGCADNEHNSYWNKEFKECCPSGCKKGCSSLPDKNTYCTCFKCKQNNDKSTPLLYENGMDKVYELCDSIGDKCYCPCYCIFGCEEDGTCIKGNTINCNKWNYMGECTSYNSLSSNCETASRSTVGDCCPTWCSTGSCTNEGICCNSGCNGGCKEDGVCWYDSKIWYDVYYDGQNTNSKLKFLLYKYFIIYNNIMLIKEQLKKVKSDILRITNESETGLTTFIIYNYDQGWLSFCDSGFTEMIEEDQINILESLNNKYDNILSSRLYLAELYAILENFNGAHNILTYVLESKLIDKIDSSYIKSLKNKKDMFDKLTRDKLDMNIRNYSQCVNSGKYIIPTYVKYSINDSKIISKECSNFDTNYDYNLIKRYISIQTNLVENIIDINSDSQDVITKLGYYTSILPDDINNSQQVVDILKQTNDVYDTFYNNITIKDIQDIHRNIIGKHVINQHRLDNGQINKFFINKGEWRCILVYCANPRPVLFKNPLYIDEKMNRFVHKYNSLKDTDVNPWLLAAWVHYNFIIIHPFSDGNGRVVRILASIPLKKINQNLIINIINEKKYYYYKALDEVTKTKNLIPLALELYRQTKETYKYVLTIPEPSLEYYSKVANDPEYNTTKKLF
ncbi:hypothetical protein HDU92_008454 [Lobulomyces angularis]|nr:hypothetical protein HDU92_008454 [Lobulomyces angularis]